MEIALLIRNRNSNAALMLVVDSTYLLLCCEEQHHIQLWACLFLGELGDFRVDAGME